MVINEEKRQKFMEYAGKRVNNVLHDMQILEPMSRSAAYDFTRQDVDEMFAAMQETLNNVKAEFEKKFEEKARAEKKTFVFGQTTASEAAVTATAPAVSETEPVVTATVAEATLATDASAEDTF
ncbi:MAG: hypothetical protein IJX99_03905 [Clostridia bacterium]|nr:hypothetical protein [Clostridia bacterium]